MKIDNQGIDERSHPYEVLTELYKVIADMRSKEGGAQARGWNDFADEIQHVIRTWLPEKHRPFYREIYFTGPRVIRDEAKEKKNKEVEVHGQASGDDAATTQTEAE